MRRHGGPSLSHKGIKLFVSPRFLQLCRKCFGNGFILKEGRLRLDIRNNFFYNSGYEALEQIAQRDGGCLVPWRQPKSDWAAL